MSLNTKGIDFPLFGMVDGRFVKYSLVVSDLGTQDDMIRKVSSEMPTNLLKAFLLPGGKMANVQTKSGLVICWTEISMLRIATVWSMTAEGTKYPVFKHRAENSPPEHEASYDWDPKLVGMRMFFTSTFKIEGGVYKWVSSYMVCKAPKRNEIFRPPLPNIFSDCRMCLGNDYQHSNACLADAFAHTIAHLESSKWNSDAMEGLTMDHIRAMFSFKDNKQIPPPKDYKWTDCPSCHSSNNMNYGELPLV